MSVRTVFAILIFTLGTLPAQAVPRPAPHTHVLPQKVDGRTDLWARGPAYLVRFAAETLFIPKLGPQATELARFEWRTLGLFDADGRKLPAAPGAHRPDRFRCDRDLGFATERYDVLEEGLEQSFVLARRPALAGDLCLRGAVGGNLHANDRAPQHAAITWFDRTGQAVVEYGAAFAIDAAGERFELATGVSGNQISICLPASLLGTAAYPLTIDPLMARAEIFNSTAFPYLDDVSIVRTPLAVTHPVLVGQLEGFSASWRQLSLYVTRDDFSDPLPVATAWSLVGAPRNVSLAVGDGGHMFLCAFDWEGSVAPCAIVRVDAVTNALPDGKILYVPAIPGFHDSNPQIGGNLGTGSPDCLVVFERKPNWTTQTEITAVRIEAATGTFRAPFTIANADTFTNNARPSVSKDAAGFGWVVAWESISTLIGRHRVYARRVSVNGMLASGLLSTDRGSLPVHEIAPQVDGSGHYAVVYGEVDALRFPTITGDEAMSLRARRFDWGPLDASPTALPSQELVAHSERTERALSLAFDATTRSHWALATRDLINDNLRLRVFGMTGIQLRNELLHAGSTSARGSAASVTYDPSRLRFPIAYTTSGDVGRTYGTFELHPDHPVTAYGTGCAPGQSYVLRDFLRGSEYATVALQNAAASRPTALFLSGGSANLPLDVLGMPGCSLLVDVGPAFLASLPGGTDANGFDSVTLPLVETVPAFDLYAQWLVLAPGANALGVQSTAGLRIRIR